ncbi:carbohydrate ABC transporter permease [Kribbella shirazensis]|uniref:Multiple sugar transport system permease protein/putative aldouronate transport system permease protein n=1 Tax=Kribbella shirazensis TaxID=1105143 RepID=A0A7X5VKZ9_9ACTN|nr:carbohydrate ABC transporter permease [Kribbella shirazensis]NIK62018.1 multiple sugar transport system permease protein/putative aldouronate transport system permease protein [Kribbella shirazensis]
MTILGVTDRRRTGGYQGLRNGQPLPSPTARVLRGAALAVCCFLVLFPFVGVVTTSFAGQDDVNRTGGLVMLPREWTLDAYQAIFSGGVVTRALLVSVFVTVVGTLCSMAVSTLLGYALSSPTMVGRGWMLMLVLLSLLFSPGLIPSYLLVKQLGLIDSLWALIVPTMLSGFNVIVVRAFFMGIPDELLQSARIDGAGEWAIFRLIVLPLSKAVLAVVGLFYAVGYWNAFFNVMLYINDQSKWTLQYVLRTYVVNNTRIGGDQVNVDALPPQPALQMAVLVVSIVPVLLVYPFLQRHFAKGALTGAVKG